MGIYFDAHRGYWRTDDDKYLAWRLGNGSWMILKASGEEIKLCFSRDQMKLKLSELSN